MLTLAAIEQIRALATARRPLLIATDLDGTLAPIVQQASLARVSPATLAVLERLAADIFRIDPRELIVAEPVFHDPELKPVFDMLGRIANPQPPTLFDSASAPSRSARRCRAWHGRPISAGF